KRTRSKYNHVTFHNRFNYLATGFRFIIIETIMESDMIVLGPGSLFTSILPNLMISDIGKALKETKAEVTYVCNIMTQRGETEFFSDADHVAVLNAHLAEQFIDTVLVNIEPVPQEYMNSNQFDEYLVQVKHDFAGLQKQANRVISSNFLRLENGGAFHDGDLVVEELLKILQVRP
ncbi:2-phospho-L-lactate transferase CofD family protein, partial [Streptococcus suis]|uniref:2-phospho-L-lactate transferase CofD family protein n=1 Tax=Streptococcus suis TaxID=1307 RepID=UPI000A87E0F1